MKEFEFIDKFLKPLAGKDSLGLGDDCAFYEGYCVTKDVLVEGVHFLKGDDAFNLARKALRVNLSGLAASGAVPFGFMLGLALPKNTSDEWLKKFAAGLKADIKKYKIQMLGGDTTTHKGGLVISVTAIGKTKKPVLRSGAKVGDNIFVTGFIGKGLVGLRSQVSGIRSQYYELPEPRVDLIPVVRKNASACIDVSDGLLADLGHICKASKVGAEVFLNEIPLADKKKNIAEQLNGGDDYELCFTSKMAKIRGCHRIGRIVPGSGIKLDGKKIKARGFEHKLGD